MTPKERVMKKMDELLAEQPHEPDKPLRTRVAELEVKVDKLAELSYLLLTRISQLQDRMQEKK
jgi:hypothetical protein